MAFWMTRVRKFVLDHPDEFENPQQLLDELQAHVLGGIIETGKLAGKFTEAQINELDRLNATSAYQAL
jgi:hypothetical protein